MTRPMTLRARAAAAIAAAAALTVALAASAASDGDNRPATVGQQLAVPAYFYPGGEGFELWSQLAAAGDQVGIVVANPASGPGVVRDPNYAAAIRAAADAGATVLGYVPTGYLGTTGRVTRLGATTPESWFAQVQQDVARWYQLYGDDGLGGIFFDEVQNVCGPGGRYADAYRELDASTKRLHRGERSPFTVINPGIDTDRCYADIADVILTIENTYQAYLDWEPPAWHRTVDPRRLWHLVHTTATEEQMAHAMQLAKHRNAGYVYITPDVLANPWDTLPPADYWQREISEAQPGGRSDTTPPTAPGRLLVSRPGSTQLALTWPPAHDAGGMVVGYDLYIEGVRVAGTTGRVPQATLTGLEPSTSYQVQVRARDRAGNTSAFSRAASVTTREADPSVPEPPADLRPVDVRQASITLAWTPSPEPDVASYEVSLDGTNVLSLPSWLYGGDPVTAPLSGLEAATTYTIRVAARDASGNISDDAGPLALTTLEPSGDPISDTSGFIDGGMVTYQAQFNRPFDFHHVFIDVDNDDTTGFTVAGIGADFLIENAWLYRHAGGGWNWAPVDGPSPLVSFQDDFYVWRVAAALLADALGSPLGAHRVVFHGSGSSPEAFSDVVTVE